MRDTGDGHVELGIGIGALIDRQGAVIIKPPDDGVGHRHLKIGFQTGVPGNRNINAADTLEIATGNVSHAIPGASAKHQDNKNGECAPDNRMAHGLEEGVLSEGAGDALRGGGVVEGAGAGSGTELGAGVLGEAAEASVEVVVPEGVGVVSVVGVEAGVGTLVGAALVRGAMGGICPVAVAPGEEVVIGSLGSVGSAVLAEGSGNAALGSGVLSGGAAEIGVLAPVP